MDLFQRAINRELEEKKEPQTVDWSMVAEKKHNPVDFMAPTDSPSLPPDRFCSLTSDHLGTESHLGTEELEIAQLSNHIKSNFGCTSRGRNSWPDPGSG